MIKAVIVEDESKNVGILKKLLAANCPDVEIVGVAEDVPSGYTLIQQINPALVFLDIEMPYGTGFDLLEKIKSITFEVIFVTAYNQYAIKAFKYNSIDYLLKPIDEEELTSAVARAKDRINNKTTSEGLLKFLNSMKQQSTPAKIGLPTNAGFVFIAPEEIIRCEADGAYSHIHYGQDKVLMVSKNLKELESFLDENIFCRVHHSHLINVNKVKKYVRGKGGEIEMEDGSIIQVSVRKKNDFLDKYNL